MQDQVGQLAGHDVGPQTVHKAQGGASGSQTEQKLHFHLPGRGGEGGGQKQTQQPHPRATRAGKQGRWQWAPWAGFGPSSFSAAARSRQTGSAPADSKPGQRKRALVSGRGEHSSREGLRESLQTEHERQVGTKPHSLGGPAAAKITDKVTYKEGFYFTSNPQRLTAEPPAGERHRGAEASPAAPARSPGTSVSRRNVSLKRQGEREGGKGRVQNAGQRIWTCGSQAIAPNVWISATVGSGGRDHSVCGVPWRYNPHSHTLQTGVPWGSCHAKNPVSEQPWFHGCVTMRQHRCLQ